MATIKTKQKAKSCRLVSVRARLTESQSDERRLKGLLSFRLRGTAGLMVSRSPVGRERLESLLPRRPCINALAA